MIRGKLPIAFLCKFSLTPAKITAELESHQFRIYRQNITYKTCWILQIIHIQYLHLSSRIDDSRKMMRKKMKKISSHSCHVYHINIL